MGHDQTMLIPLTQGKFAVVDAQDYDRLSRYKWCAAKSKKTFYAERFSNGRLIKMHREIIHTPKGMQCDHINHNGLDNRKSNLRLCTNAENLRNQKPAGNGSSRYKGVSWSKQRRKWRASICCDYRVRTIGRFDNKPQAAMAYDDKAIELFGEFAYLNFPDRIELRNWIKKIVWAA